MNRPVLHIPATMPAVLLTGNAGSKSWTTGTTSPFPCVATEVLLGVGACGINNTDINLRTRWYDRAGSTELTQRVGLHGVALEGAPQDEASGSWNEEPVKFPRIQGAAVVCRIAAVGASVNPSRIGERVILGPQVRDLSIPTPAGINFDVGVYRTAAQAHATFKPARQSAYGASKSRPYRALGGEDRVSGAVRGDIFIVLLSNGMELSRVHTCRRSCLVLAIIVDKLRTHVRLRQVAAPQAA